MKNLVFLAVLAFGSLVVASDRTNISSGLTLAGPGLAVHGYDVVAFFKAGRAIRGSGKFTAVHEQATYEFANKENLEQFQKNPAAYLPQFGGYCAMGAALGKKLDGDPECWRVVEGKLYLNVNEEIQQKWAKDLEANIAKAHKNWQTIADKAPSALN